MVSTASMASATIRETILTILLIIVTSRFC